MEGWSWSEDGVAPSEALRDVLEDWTVPSFVTDPIGNICGVNQAWVAMCGYRPCQALGKPATIMQGDLTDREAAASHTRRLRENGKSCSTLCNYTKSGRAFANEISSVCLHDADTGDGSVNQYYLTESREVQHEEIEHAITAKTMRPFLLQTATGAKRPRMHHPVLLIGLLLAGPLFIVPTELLRGGQALPAEQTLNAVKGLSWIVSVLFKCISCYALFLLLAAIDVSQITSRVKKIF
mmetsp:Transcript_9843/g.16369  ORF Transcript_9843/g.16369 Transcript_9843/m.16369 type:complete len:238 (+) Transcript_9843:42-755(+)